MAHVQKTMHLDGVLPNTSGKSLFVPQNGSYEGSFTQGMKEYSVSVDLHFIAKKTQRSENGTIQFYSLDGSGSDYMGLFRIQSGQCRVGDRTLFAFYKKYTKINKPYTSSLHKLLYTGAMDPNGLAGGSWHFVDKSEAKDENGIDLSLEGSFEFTCTSVATAKEFSPLLADNCGINLTKSPMPV